MVASKGVDLSPGLTPIASSEHPSPMSTEIARPPALLTARRIFRSLLPFPNAATCARSNSLTNRSLALSCLPVAQRVECVRVESAASGPSASPP
jgi:hypothetical protein